MVIWRSGGWGLEAGGLGLVSVFSSLRLLLPLALPSPNIFTPLYLSLVVVVLVVGVVVVASLHYDRGAAQSSRF